MSNEACVIVGVPLDLVVETATRQVSVKRFNERTGEPYEKNIKELAVIIAGKVVYQDEDECFYDEYASLEAFVDAKIQEVVGSFGVIQIFREYQLIGVDLSCIDEGEKVGPDRFVMPLDIGGVISAMNALDTTLENAFRGNAPRSSAYLCGTSVEECRDPIDTWDEDDEN